MLITRNCSYLIPLRTGGIYFNEKCPISEKFQGIEIPAELKLVKKYEEAQVTEL